MELYLEHANITVNNLDNSISFFQTAFPSFQTRGGGESNGRKWIHFGNDRTYLALNEKGEEVAHEKSYSKTGINHIGFVVSDLEALSQRLLDAGYTRSFPKQVESTRIRDYFLDDDGNEYEFVEYLSDKLSERNLYA